MADSATQATDSSVASEQGQGSVDSESETNQGIQNTGQDDSQKTDDKTDTGSKVDETKTTDNAGSGDKKTEVKPQSRRSAAFRIQQLNDQIRDLKAGKGAKAADSNDQQDDGNTQDDTKQPDIAAIVAAEVAKALKPYESATTRTADDAEINELFAGKPDEQKKYEAQIREKWNLPQYKDLSAQDVYRMLSFDDAVKAASAQAIETFKKAEKDAKESSTGGTSTRGKGGAKTAWDLSEAEFKAVNEKVRAGG